MYLYKSCSGATFLYVYCIGPNPNTLLTSNCIILYTRASDRKLPNPRYKTECLRLHCMI